MADSAIPDTTSAESSWRQIELSGIEPVPPTERPGRLWHLFFGWFTPGLSIIYVSVGAGLISFGMSITQAIIAAAVGTFLSMTLSGVIASGSAASGTPTSLVGRKLSPAGRLIRALFCWLFSLTLAAAGISIATLSTAQILHDLDWVTGSWSKVVTLVLVTVLVSVVCLSGYESIIWARLSFGILLAVLSAVSLTAVLRSIKIKDTPSGSWLAVGLGIAVVMTFTGLLWTHLAGDLSRYQPARARGTIVTFSALGGTVGPLALITIGALIASSSHLFLNTLLENPLASLSALLPKQLLLAFLVTVSLSVMGLAVSNLYGAGLTMISAGIRISRLLATLIGIVLAGTASAVIVLRFPDKLLVLGIAALILLVPVAAWAGVSVTSLLFPARSDLVRTLAFIIAVAVGWSLVGIYHNFASGRWALGIVAALTIGLLGGIGARLISGAPECTTELAEKPEEEPVIESDEEPVIEPSSELPTELFNPFFAAITVEEPVEEPIEGSGEKSVTGLIEESLTTEGLADQSHTPTDELAKKAETTLVPESHLDAEADHYVDQTLQNANQYPHLEGIYRPSSFDEEQIKLSKQRRPSRAMSDEEQEVLEELLITSGNLSLYVDDGTAESPARPRRGFIDE